MASRPSISVRLDAEAASALRTLENSGLSRSGAIRHSLVLAASQRRARAALAEEATALAKNPDDVREKARISAALDEISEPW